MCVCGSGSAWSSAQVQQSSKVSSAQSKCSAGGMRWRRAVFAHRTALSLTRMSAHLGCERMEARTTLSSLARRTARRLALLSAHVGCTGIVARTCALGCSKVWLARLRTKGVRITEAGSLKQGAIPCVEFYLAHHCSRVAEAGSIPMCRVLEYVMRCAYQGACQTVV